LLVHGRWFSPGTPASSATKTDRHDLAEILLKVALNTKNQIKSIQLDSGREQLLQYLKADKITRRNRRGQPRHQLLTSTGNEWRVG
jgi:hypothetical protein